MPNGLMKFDELIDSIIEDVNLSIKNIAIGNYVAWSAVNVQMVQKLSKLKSGVISDLKAKDENIETLKKELRKAGVEIIDVPVKNPIKDGGENGSN